VAERLDIANTLGRALAILAETQDVVVGRIAEADVPEWAERRGWSDFLLGLCDDQLLEAERDPARFLASCTEAPESLRTVAADASALGAQFEDVSEPDSGMPERHVKRRKQAQLDAFSAVALREFAGVARVVDLGSGHGHLTRTLARALRPEQTLGIDWDHRLVARAIDLAGEQGPRFVHADVNAGVGDDLMLTVGDLVVGLHPCGDLGDALVRRAREAGADVLAVSCCFQKTERDARNALSERAKAARFSVPKHALGLANLSNVSFDGCGSLADKRTWRETRLALRLLLEARGVVLAPGEESRGVPKDRVRQGLAEIAALSFAKRGLSPATTRELAEAAARAERAHAANARLSLPRHALACVLELAIVHDRARLLEEGGWRTSVVTLFSSRTSPRNLAIVAVAPR
jgi:SAM-dependent methyltransferase